MSVRSWFALPLMVMLFHFPVAAGGDDDVPLLPPGSAITPEASITPESAIRPSPITPGSSRSLANPDDDEVINRTYISPTTKPVGEVRLVRRGRAAVVQTLLYTNMLRRVVAEIGKKEKDNWTPANPGYEDSPRYMDALNEAQQTIWSQIPKNNRTSETPRQNLFIEFVLDAQSAGVLMGEFEVSDGPDGVEVRDRRLISSLDASREYVRRNMELIVADTFKVSEGEARTLLAPLPGWSQ